MKNTFRMLIDNKWVNSTSGETIDVFNPANEEIVGSVPKGGAEEAKKALKAAQCAFKSWAALPVSERGALLHKAADLMRQSQEEISRLLTMEQGKPLSQARGEVTAAADSIDYFAEEGRRIRGEIILTDKTSQRSLVIKQPLGVVVAIAPTNYPVCLMAWKIAPALVAGCTVVCKPSSETPLATAKFIQCFVDAGIPNGVVNYVTGSGSTLGRELVSNPITRKVTITGGTEVGKEVMRMAADGVKRLSLELGGQCPMLICSDADIEAAAKGACYRGFRNTGQVCNSVNRIYVERKVYEHFLSEVINNTRKLTIEDGLKNPEVDLGPLLNENTRQRVIKHIQDAIDKGGQVAYGGKVPEGFDKGFFFEPTVIVDANHEMAVMREETFGPVIPIMAVDGVEAAVKLANDTVYGLVAYVYTKDLKTALLVAEALEYGTVGVNNVSGGEHPYPYGGWKQSGFGLELSHYGVEEFLAIKHIRLDIGY